MWPGKKGSGTLVLPQARLGAPGAGQPPRRGMGYITALVYVIDR